DWLAPHQANLRIIEATARRTGLSRENIMVNIQKYGNTTAATIPLCLYDWKDKLMHNDNVILAAFGGGYTWGSLLLKWGIKQFMATAYLFPGQGSQSVGMGKEHFTNNDVFAEYVTKANNILGFDIQQIMFEGPVEKLKQTEFTQPAIYLHSVALFKMLEAEPDMVAGHCLGEFSALVACNAVEFEEALKIVRRRGQLMQKAGEENPGTMAAIIGMSDEAVEEACAVATKEVGTEVIAANYNCPGQLVISGDKVAVKKAVDLLKEEG